MSLQEKLLDPQQFVLLYGTTPPRAESTSERIMSAAQKLAARVQHLPLDGMIVYDVQDESTRTNIPRPFPFLPTIDPRAYTKILHDILGKPVVTYKCIADITENNWGSWLTETRNDYGISYLSLVGLPSTRGGHSAISLSRATQLASMHPGRFTLGGVVIAERHSTAHSESQRMMHKANNGCSFFISQAVYQAETTISMLGDYYRECRQQGVSPKRVVLTFIPCGRPKTMEFMKWLGIGISDETEQVILDAPTPLTKSIQVCCENLRAILDQEYTGKLPLGLNIESVSINKEEIDASIDLFHALTDVLQTYRR